MPDYFAVFDKPRRPWIDPEALKETFFALSASIHPDRVHHLSAAEREAAQSRYAELNAAYNCLRDPKMRLRHLLELELGSVPKDIQSIPSGLMDLSLEIGGACREADGMISEKNRATSPLLKVQLFERSQQLSDRLRSLQRVVSGKHEALISELRELDSRWASGSAGSTGHAEIIQQLERVYRLFSYFERWLSQLRERIVQLAF